MMFKQYQLCQYRAVVEDYSDLHWIIYPVSHQALTCLLTEVHAAGLVCRFRRRDPVKSLLLASFSQLCGNWQSASEQLRCVQQLSSAQVLILCKSLCSVSSIANREEPVSSFILSDICRHLEIKERLYHWWRGRDQLCWMEPVVMWCAQFLTGVFDL